MYKLARIYSKGELVYKDQEKAFELYLLAASNGHKESMIKVGECYSYGIGVKKNQKEAQKWYKNGNTK